MICFICKINVKNLSSLVVHFKVFHSLTSYSTYECCESPCSHIFSSLGKFKRHVINKHEKQNTISSTNPSLSSQYLLEQSSSNNDNENPVATVDIENNSEQEIIENDFNYNKSINNIYKLAVDFDMDLHNNNNFNFKDIIIIQSELKEKILKPMSLMLGEIIQINIQEPIIKGKFHTFSVLLSDPFIHCSNKYNLDKWLMQNDYLDNLKQITINNEVRVVQHDGIVTYDEAITKGVLLPLRFQFQKFFEHGDNFKNMYEKTIALNQNNSNIISNFIQCDLWKNKISQNNQKLVFPFFFVY